MDFSEIFGTVRALYLENNCPALALGWNGEEHLLYWVGIAAARYPCSSLCPFLSMQVCSTALTSAAGSTTSAHKPSHPCSIITASETSDSTPSLTATVMPGWQQPERVWGSGTEQGYPVLGYRH